MDELIAIYKEIAIEVVVVIAYVRLFHYLVYRRDVCEGRAFAPELSTVTVVLYATAVVDIVPDWIALAGMSIAESSEPIHGLFRVPELLMACIVLPALAVAIVVEQVRAYQPKPAPHPPHLIWRANLSGISTCFAMIPFRPYILHWALEFVPHT
jgi:hypothetical protein